jgi:hypothetical protein
MSEKESGTLLEIQSVIPSVTALGTRWEMELVMASGTLSETASGMVSESRSVN